MRQIVAEVLRKRPVDDRSDYLKVELARLVPALRLAGEAIARGDIKAIAPYLNPSSIISPRESKKIQIKPSPFFLGFPWFFLEKFVGSRLSGATRSA